MACASQRESQAVSGLKCGVCGEGWKLDRPLLYHLGELHCDNHKCSRTCSECKDWEHAVENGGAHQSQAQGATHPGAEPTGSIPGAAPVGSFDKAPGYAAMMARLKENR